jgi:protein ImuA
MHTVHEAALSALPAHLAQAVWPGHTLGAGGGLVMGSGHPALDAELPGGGWPCQALTEILQMQAGLAEWRLLSPVLAQLVRQGGSVLLIAPPHVPHLPGLAREGLPDHRFIRVDAHTTAERLWATEQALKAGCVSAVLSWLPHVRAQQVRRLHACAAQHPGLFFAFRPLQAQSESSAAPLRLTLGLGPCPHPLQVQLFKRRGPAQDAPLSLAHWPSGLKPLLLPDLPFASPAPSFPSVPPQSLPAALPTALPSAPQPTHHVELDRPAARTTRGPSPVRRHRGDRRRALGPATMSLLTEG